MKSNALNLQTNLVTQYQQPSLLTAVVVLAFDQEWQLEHQGQTFRATRAASCLLRPMPNDTVLCVQLMVNHVMILAVLSREENTKNQYDFSSSASLIAQDEKLSLVAPQLEFHGQDSTLLDTPLLNVWVNQAALAITNLHYRGEQINNQTQYVKHYYHLLDEEIETTQLTAKTVLESVTEMKHQVLGDVHTLVQNGYRVDCGHASLYSDAQFNIQGKQINMS